MQPTELIASKDARLPDRYSAARDALAACYKLDECQTWANKAEALASYARQAADETLRKYCDRIQARAIRRCGELLKQVPSGQGSRNQYRQADTVTRSEAAQAAGLSERQRATAIRLASIPASEFESRVESDDPPSVTALAEIGRRPMTKRTASADELRAAVHSLTEFVRFTRTHDAAQVGRVIVAETSPTNVRGIVSELDRWLDTLIVSLDAN